MYTVNLTYEGIDYEIHYEYQPEEKQSWGHNGGHPPIHEAAQVYHMYYDGVDYVNELDLEEVEKAVLNYLKEYNEY